MRLLGGLFRRHIGKAALALAAIVGAVAVSLWWNACLARLIESVGIGLWPGGAPVWGALAAVAASSATALLQAMATAWVAESMAHSLRMGLAHHMAALDLAQVEKVGAGEALSRLQNEVEEVGGYLGGQLFPLAGDLVRFALTLAWMLMRDARLTLVSCLPVLPLILYTVYTGRVIGRTARQTQAANARMNGFAEALITAFPVVRLFDAAPLLLRRHEGALADWEHAAVREGRTRAGLMSLSAVLSVMPLLALLFFGGRQVVAGQTALGTLYVFINLSGNISGILPNLPGRLAHYGRFAVNLDRLSPSVRLKGEGA